MLRTIGLLFVLLFAISSRASDASFKELFPDEFLRKNIESALEPLWQHSTSRCTECHGHGESGGWDKYRSPKNFDFWKSTVIGQLGFENNVDRPDQFKLYQHIANDLQLYGDKLTMPPRDIEETDPIYLMSLPQEQGNPITITEKGLGTQPLYITAKGDRCFSRASEQDLCWSFLFLHKLIKESGVDTWNRAVKKASDPKFDHGKAIFHPIADEPDQPDITIPASNTIHTLPKGHAIMFYTRVAPDESFIGYSTSRRGKKFNPVVLDLKRNRRRTLNKTSYDPTFAPDFNLSKKTGFMVATNGLSAASVGKIYSFFRPTSFSGSGSLSPRYRYRLPSMSGYGTIAKLTDKSVLPRAWQRFSGKYLVMGKKWRWFVVDRNMKKVYPSGNGSGQPICSGTNRLAIADSMISKNGAYISVKKGLSLVPRIFRTSDCKLLSSPALEGMYGGKATFAYKHKYIVFHAFGVDGRTKVSHQSAGAGMIERAARQGKIANIFIYDFENDRLAKLTNNHSGNPYVSMFPDFSGDDKTIYFHSHRKGNRSSEIMTVPNPFLRN